jgi:hypothetical protein
METYIIVPIVKTYLVDTINVCEPCFGRWPCYSKFFYCLITTYSISTKRNVHDRLDIKLFPINIL